MFPWTDGFHWTPTHIIFLTLFFSAVIVIASTFVAGIMRTTGDFRARRAAEMCWRQTFAGLPENERHCRHQFAGRLASRICDNAFACGSCPKYAEFAALAAHVDPQKAGIGYSEKLLYHRGHTWVRPEKDGTYTIGLDGFASHVIGDPDSVELPGFGSEIENEGVAWRMTKNGHKIRVRAPLGGTVIATGGKKNGWYVNVLPHGPVNLQHLLSGAEVAGWLANEIDRLQMQLSAPGAPPCLADGGTLMPNLMDAEPKADWDTVLASTFLDV
jgi:glycine cleavage system H lipoate-binding protein